MRFVCSRTFIANSIFSPRHLISWRPQDTDRQLKPTSPPFEDISLWRSLVRQDSPCIVVCEQRHVSSARTHVYSGLVSQVSWHGHSGIDRMRGACYVAILRRIMFPDTRIRFAWGNGIKIFRRPKGIVKT